MYKPFLLQKLTAGAPVVDSLDYNIWAKSIPFRPMPDLKEPFIRDNPDRNGNEVYYPPNPVYKAYDMTCEFVYMGSEDSATPMIRLFIRYLVENGMFKFYDEWMKIGRTNVNYKSFGDDGKFTNVGKNIVVFKMTFTVNDPITDIVLIKTT